MWVVLSPRRMRLRERLRLKLISVRITSFHLSKVKCCDLKLKLIQLNPLILCHVLLIALLYCGLWWRVLRGSESHFMRLVVVVVQKWMCTWCLKEMCKRIFCIQYWFMTNKGIVQFWKICLLAFLPWVMRRLVPEWYQSSHLTLQYRK